MPPQTINGDLQVNGKINATGILGTDAGLILGSGAFITEGVIAGGDITTQGNLSAAGNLQTGSAAIQGDMTISGNQSITGDHTVSGTLKVGVDIVLQGADLAEDVATLPDSDVSPGTVMVIGDDGLFTHCAVPYDSRVAGVISGAAPHRPGMILGRTGDGSGMCPIALVGRVSCKVDATISPIAAGDLLTTSGTPGYAMKADDRSRAFGAVIGKALGPLAGGRGIVPILVGLR